MYLRTCVCVRACARACVCACACVRACVHARVCGRTRAHVVKDRLVHNIPFVERITVGT